jgi:ABC-type uncharacterized transport system fused permease/ATPase subunit
LSYFRYPLLRRHWKPPNAGAGDLASTVTDTGSCESAVTLFSVVCSALHSLVQGTTRRLAQRIDEQRVLVTDNPARLKTSYLLRRFWKSAAGFWSQRGIRVSWVLSGTLLLLILLNLATSYGMNVWTRSIFDALQKRDSDSVLLLSMVYLPLLAASVFFSVMQVYARMTTQRRWREWLNNHLVDRWLKNGRYYQLNLMSGGHKNPEYRVADDVRVATESPVDFVTGMTAAILSATTFVVVLWTIGGALTDMTITSTWLSRYCCSDLCPGGEQLHGGHRALLRQGVGG